jgi:hypothetical protein
LPERSEGNLEYTEGFETNWLWLQMQVAWDQGPDEKPGLQQSFSSPPRAACLWLLIQYLVSVEPETVQEITAAELR